ncbi:MAG: hypothetical protein KAJ19_21500, partial [Gammaproteobacteria bacterium]|nr:hypothetical protein [Gammaproteobacteria bacterium]
MATLLGVRSDRVSGTNPFEDASIFTSNTASFVEEQIESVSVVAADTLTLAQTAIAELSQLSDVIATLPAYDVSAPILDPNMDVTIDLPDIDAELWGRVDDFEVGNAIDTSNLPSISAVSIPGFSPTPFVISIPDAPNPSDITTPGAVPTAPALTFPAEVIVALPSYPGLEPILIPLFTTPTVDDLDITYPTLTEQNISTTIDWTEPTYTEEVIDEVKAQLSVFFAGGSGIDPVVEESIFARGRDREDEVIKQQEQQATDEWANKGYTAPPGMLVKRIDNIREAGTIKKLGLNREQTIKVFDTEIENLRFSVQQG